MSNFPSRVQILKNRYEEETKSEQTAAAQNLAVQSPTPQFRSPVVQKKTFQDPIISARDQQQRAKLRGELLKSSSTPQLPSRPLINPPNNNANNNVNNNVNSNVNKIPPLINSPRPGRAMLGNQRGNIVAPLSPTASDSKDNTTNADLVNNHTPHNNSSNNNPNITNNYHNNNPPPHINQPSNTNNNNMNNINNNNVQIQNTSPSRKEWEMRNQNNIPQNNTQPPIVSGNNNINTMNTNNATSSPKAVRVDNNNADSVLSKSCPSHNPMGKFHPVTKTYSNTNPPKLDTGGQQQQQQQQQHKPFSSNSSRTNNQNRLLGDDVKSPSWAHKTNSSERNPRPRDQTPRIHNYNYNNNNSTPNPSSPNDSPLQLNLNSNNNINNNSNNEGSTTPRMKPSRPDRTSVPVNTLNTLEVRSISTDADKNKKAKGHNRKWKIEISKFTSELSLEELVEKIYEAFRKTANAFKQIVVVSRHISQSLAENVTAETTKELELLSTSSVKLAEKVKQLQKMGGLSIEDIVSVFPDILECSDSAYFLIDIFCSISSAQEDIIKQILTSITTYRDSLTMIIDLSQFHNILKTNSHIKKFRSLQTTIEASIYTLISTKSGKLISSFKRSEFEASAQIAVISLNKLMNSFSQFDVYNFYRDILVILNQAKVASSSLSLVIAVLNESISINVYFLAMPNIKPSIVSHILQLKDLFYQFMEETKSQLSHLYNSQKENEIKENTMDLSALQKKFDKVRLYIKEIITDFLRYCEVDASELSRGKIPSYNEFPKIIERAEKLTDYGSGISSLNEISDDRLYHIDLPDDFVPDVDPIHLEPEENDGRILMLENSPNSIKAATLNKLIISLTSVNFQDMNFTRTFIITYRSFTTPTILIRKLIQRFEQPFYVTSNDELQTDPLDRTNRPTNLGNIDKRSDGTLGFLSLIEKDKDEFDHNTTINNNTNNNNTAATTTAAVVATITSPIMSRKETVGGNSPVPRDKKKKKIEEAFALWAGGDEENSNNSNSNSNNSSNSNNNNTKDEKSRRNRQPGEQTFQFLDNLAEIENIEQAIHTVRLRVCAILRHWIETQSDDLTPENVQVILKFLDVLIADPKFSKLGSQIRKHVERILEKKSKISNEMINFNIEPNITISPSTLLFIFDEEEIAKQLSIIDFKLFALVKPVELVNQAWSKPKLKHRAPHVLAMISRTTAVSFWVSSVIIWQDTIKARSRAFSKMILLAQHLYKLNNYNTLMAVLAGLNNSAVFRLRHTKSTISPHLLEILQELQETMDSNSSFANYRQKIRSSDPPCVPFLGTYLTDLTFIEDGNPDFLKGLINFRKRELVANVIRDVITYQNIGYMFPVVESIANFVTDLPFMSESDLYDMSLILEPRGATLEEIL